MFSNDSISKQQNLNPFLGNVPILYQRFSGVFRGNKMGTLGRNGLIVIEVTVDFTARY